MTIRSALKHPVAIGALLLAIVFCAWICVRFANGVSRDTGKGYAQKSPVTEEAQRSLPISSERALHSPTSGDQPHKQAARSLRHAKIAQLEPLQGDLAPQISALQVRANAGDTKAAVNLWYGLDRCKAVLSDSELAYVKSGAAPNPDGYAEVQRATLESCRDVTSEQIAHRYDWLKRAAAQGDPQAQYFYATAGSGVFGGANEALRDPQDWAEYKSTATSYLDALVQQCDPSAISYLWWGYRHGDQLFSPDLPKALYYRQISELMNPTENTPAILALAHDGLSQQDIDSQTQAAGQFYQGLCQ